MYKNEDLSSQQAATINNSYRNTQRASLSRHQRKNKEKLKQVIDGSQNSLTSTIRSNMMMMNNSRKIPMVMREKQTASSGFVIDDMNENRSQVETELMRVSGVSPFKLVP